jgi:hypothetical protein
MLFMNVYTFEPEKRDEVIKRRAEKGSMAPQGMKTISEWTNITGGRVFRLVELDDPRVMLASATSWDDIGKIESFPVMQTEEVMKLLNQ